MLTRPAQDHVVDGTPHTPTPTHTQLDTATVQRLVRTSVWGRDANSGVHSAMPPPGPDFTHGASCPSEPNFVPPALVLDGSVLGMKTYRAATGHPKIRHNHSPLANVIRRLAKDVFQWSAAKVSSDCSLFWESTSSSGAPSATIAYNNGGKLYFNSCFFAKLKHNDDGKVALAYWFVAFCHELAHNTETKHNANFASVFGEIVAAYLARFGKL